MKPSLDSAAAPTSAVPNTPIPSLAMKIIGVSSYLLRIGVARVDPDADIFFVAAYSHQGRVADIFKRFDGSFHAELVLGGVRNQSLNYIPRYSHVHIFFRLFVDDVHDNLPVLFSDADVVAGVLHGDKFAFGRGFQRVENGAHVYLVCVQIADVNFAVAQLSVINGGNDLLSQRERHINANEFVGSRVGDFYMKIAGGRSGDSQGRSQKKCRGQSHSREDSFHGCHSRPFRTIRSTRAIKAARESYATRF